MVLETARAHNLGSIVAVVWEYYTIAGLQVIIVIKIVANTAENTHIYCMLYESDGIPTLDDNFQPTASRIISFGHPLHGNTLNALQAVYPNVDIEGMDYLNGAEQANMPAFQLTIAGNLLSPNNDAVDLVIDLHDVLAALRRAPFM